MALRERLLPRVQRIRDIAVRFGLRRYQVWTRLVVWSGARINLGTATTTDNYLGRVKVRDVKSEDIVAGMSEFSDMLFELGPFTPEHSAAIALAHTKAPTPDELSPPQDGNPTEIYFVLKGPGLPTVGVLCSRVGDSVDKSFRYMVTVKNTGRAA